MVSWENLIGNVLVLVSVPLLIWIFWQVKKMDKESKKRRRELVELYSQNDNKEKDNG